MEFIVLIKLMQILFGFRLPIERNKEDLVPSCCALYVKN